MFIVRMQKPKTLQETHSDTRHKLLLCFRALFYRLHTRECHSRVFVHLNGHYVNADKCDCSAAVGRISDIANSLVSPLTKVF